MKRKSILLRVLPEHYERFTAKAQSRDLPLTKWIIQAALAYEAKGARFSKKKPQEKCTLCGKRHDRNEHFGGKVE